MSDNEDDYLSDKFLLEPASTPSSGPKTYSQRRKDAARVAAIKNAQNRKRSRREMEVESREEGLSKSLFERAQEEEASVGQQNKALAMMMKMGFKPGQALGQTEEDQPLDPVPSSSFTSTNTYTTTTTPRFLAREAENVLEHGTEESTADGLSGNEKPSVSMSKHRIVPLPLNEWAGEL